MELTIALIVIILVLIALFAGYWMGVMDRHMFVPWTEERE